MALIEDLTNSVSAILSTPWTIRDGQVVPTPESVALTGGGVKLTATMLYADLADSTNLALYNRQVAAKVYKCFLACCTRLILARGGKVRSFDGDRVMGVFLGKTKNSDAAHCALNIKYAFTDIIAPRLQTKYEALRDGTLSLDYAVGIDTSEVLVVRSGIANNNDLLWVGRAPNIAAKLSGIRSKYHSYITKSVYDSLNEGSKVDSEGNDMWTEWGSTMGTIKVLGSDHHWKP